MRAKPNSLSFKEEESGLLLYDVLIKLVPCFMETKILLGCIWVGLVGANRCVIISTFRTRIPLGGYGAFKHGSRLNLNRFYFRFDIYTFHLSECPN